MKPVDTPRRRATHPLTRHRRRLLTIVVATVLIALQVTGGAGAYEGSSLYDNVSPQAQVGGLSQQYPSSRYGLDYHVDVVQTSSVDGGIVGAAIGGLAGFLLGSGHDADVPTGINFAAVPALIMLWLASAVWDFTRMIDNAVIALFTFAFSLDLISGARGALAPVAVGVNNLYDELGVPWLPVLVTLLAIWIAVRLVAMRDIVGTFGKLGVSLCCVVLAMILVTQPAWTIGGMSHFSSQLANGILGAVNGNDTAGAKTAAADSIFETLVYSPWLVLNFGGVEHCVDANNRPVSPWSRDCQTTIDHKRKYAARWLKASPNGPARNLEYQALRDGKIPDASALSDAGAPSDYFDGYRVSDADKAAVDIQQQPLATERLAYSLFILGGSAGAWLLIGGLSFGVILSQVQALLLFAIGVVMLLAAVFPGPGHRAFRMWLERLILALTRPIWYALILSIVLAINQALIGATARLGTMMAFGLVAAFNWAVFFRRKDWYNQFVGALPGSTGAEKRERSGFDIARDLYYGSKVAAPALAMASGGVEKLAGAGAWAAGGAGRAARSGAQAAGAAVGDSVSRGHSSRMVATAALNGRALAELEDEHSGRTRRVSQETARRARIDDLERRQQIARDGEIPEADKLALTPREERELATLRRHRMDDDDYDGLRDSVNEVEQRREDTGGIPFDDEAVAERAAVIAGRGGDGPRRRRDAEDRPDYDDLVRQARRWRDNDHPRIFGEPPPPQAGDLAPPRRRARRSPDHADVQPVDGGGRPRGAPPLTPAPDGGTAAPWETGTRDRPDEETLRQWQTEWDVIRNQAAPMLDRLDEEGRAEREATTRSRPRPRRASWRRPRQPPPSDGGE